MVAVETKEMKMSNTKTSKSKPSHTLYAVQGNDDKSHWTRIGAAWLHKDGNGFSLTLDCLPLNGRIQMRLATQDDGEAQ